MTARFFATVCGKGYQTDNDANGVYQITNAGQLYWFAEYVNAEQKTINAADDGIFPQPANTFAFVPDTGVSVAKEGGLTDRVRV